MLRLEGAGLAFALISGLAGTALAEGVKIQFGEPIAQAEATKLASVLSNGQGLPPGHGDAKQGAEVFANACAACHGTKLEGIKATGAPALIGGRGTLSSAKPLKTTESYWPYATTMFDYIKHAMPFNAPGSLSDNDVYAVTAYILASGHVIDVSETMNAKTLPAVKMPNRDGFVPDPRP